MLFTEPRLILVLMISIYVLAIIQPGCSFKVCFYKERVYPTSYGQQTSLPETIIAIILFFKMKCPEHCFIKTCVKQPCQLAFTENSTNRNGELFYKKNCSGRGFTAVWLFYNCRKYAYTL